MLSKTPGVFKYSINSLFPHLPKQGFAMKSTRASYLDSRKGGLGEYTRKSIAKHLADTDYEAIERRA